MKRFRLLGIALVAVFAIGVVVAASASAAVVTLLAEWLKNGTAVTGELNTETVGTILLEDQKTPLGASDVVCSGALLGTVGEDGLDVISEVLNLAKELISSTPLTGLELICEEKAVCAGALVWPMHLPWQTLLRLMEDGTEVFFVDFLEAGTGGPPGWHVECTETILKPTDICEGRAAIQLSLEGGTLLLGTFSDPFNTLAEVPLAHCELGGAESGVVETLPTQLFLANGETLNASSETGAEA